MVDPIRPFPLTPAARATFAELYGSQDEAVAAMQAQQIRPAPSLPKKISQRVLVINDLHLNRGRDPVTGTLNRQDPWTPEQDRQFTKLMVREWDAASRGRLDIADRTLQDSLHRRGIEAQDADPYHLKLVLNGDIFDLLQLCEEDPAHPYPDGLNEFGGPLNTPNNNIAQIEAIRAGHPEFFQTLASHLLRGNSIDYIPGNHDRQMYHKGLWDAFVAVLKRDMAECHVADGGNGRPPNPEEIDAAAERIKQKPFGIYGKTYVEHGDGSDETNRVRRPYEQVFEESRCAMDACHAESFGDMLVKKGFNAVEEQFPDLDHETIGGARAFKTLLRHPSAAFKLLGGAFTAFCASGYTVSPEADKAQRVTDAQRLVQRFPEIVTSINAARGADDQLSPQQVAVGLGEVEEASAIPFYSQFPKSSGFICRCFRLLWRQVICRKEDMERRSPDDIRADRYARLHQLFGVTDFVEGHTHQAVDETLVFEDGTTGTHRNTHTWMKKIGGYGTSDETWGSNSRGVGVIMLGTQGEDDTLWSTTDLMRLEHADSALVEAGIIGEYESPKAARQAARMAQANYARNHPQAAQPGAADVPQEVGVGGFGMGDLVAQPV